MNIKYKRRAIGLESTNVIYKKTAKINECIKVYHFYSYKREICYYKLEISMVYY